MGNKGFLVIPSASILCTVDCPVAYSWLQPLLAAILAHGGAPTGTPFIVYTPTHNQAHLAKLGGHYPCCDRCTASFLLVFHLPCVRGFAVWVCISHTDGATHIPLTHRGAIGFVRATCFCMCIHVHLPTPTPLCPFTVAHIHLLSTGNVDNHLQAVFPSAHGPANRQCVCAACDTVGYCRLSGEHCGKRVIICIWLAVNVKRYTGTIMCDLQMYVSNG